jgi:SAM-dependent methyltransferase
VVSQIQQTIDRLFKRSPKMSRPEVEMPQAVISPGGEQKSFLECFGDLPLRSVFEKSEIQDLNIETESWLNFPPQEFLSWARAFPRYHFDAVGHFPQFLKPPSFLLTQTHRMWTSARLVAEESDLDAAIVDFGSFPFFLPLILRDYFKYTGALTATTIQPVPKETLAAGDQYRISFGIVDLDPYVVDRTRLDQLPLQLSYPANSADVVTMMHVVEHLYHPMSALKEANRILKPGGRLIITTDNAMNLATLLNYVAGYGYIFQPVETTAAMIMDDWRGHVRFFTGRDLQTLVQAAGFKTKRIGYEEIFYEVFHEQYFKDPIPRLPVWRKSILQKQRHFANDVYIVATKE